jgi:hypothetical protein
MSKQQPTVHTLKTHPDYFYAVECGTKNFELRKNDRSFKADDILNLLEWSEASGYTGKSIVKVITYVLEGTTHLAPGYVAIAMKDIQPVATYGPRPDSVRYAGMIENLNEMLRKNALELEALRREVKAAGLLNASIKQERDDARHEVACLESWKREMIAVDGQCDWQVLGRMLGMTLGQDVKARLIPTVEQLQKDLKEARRQRDLIEGRFTKAVKEGAEYASNLQDITNRLHKFNDEAWAGINSTDATDAWGEFNKQFPEITKEPDPNACPADAIPDMVAVTELHSAVSTAKCIKCGNTFMLGTGSEGTCSTCVAEQAAEKAAKIAEEHGTASICITCKQPFHSSNGQAECPACDIGF